MDQYFAESGDGPPAPASVSLTAAGAGENSYWLGARDGRPKTVRFPSYLAAYRPLREVGNVRRFVRQVRKFREFAAAAASDLTADPALLIAAGRCFTAVVYGQLVAENCAAAGTPSGVVSAVFLGLVEDLTAEALRLAALFPPGRVPRTLLRQAVRVPNSTAGDVTAVYDLLGERFPS